MCPGSAGEAHHLHGTELLHGAGSVEVAGSACVSGKLSWEERLWFLSFPAKTRSEKIKPGSLVGCRTGQCIQLSRTIHGSIDGFVLLRTSHAVVSAAALERDQHRKSPPTVEELCKSSWAKGN